MAGIYVIPLENDENITFQQFAIGCLRNFGIYTHFNEEQRKKLEDYILPSKFCANDHFLDKYNEIKERYGNLLNNPKSEEELEAEYEEYARNVISSNDFRIKRSKTLRERYEKMLSKVRTWVPPTEEHNGIKSFMEKQLLDSIEEDCDDLYLERITPKDEWIKSKKDYSHFIDTMNSYLEMYKKGVASAEKATQFIKEFSDSIKDVK